MADPPHEVFLPSGSLCCSVDPIIVNTVLGSCVSVCFWDRRLRIGGINHFLLPRWNGEGEPSLRYGDVAIRQLLAEMEELGSRKADLHAKIFGGAAVLSLPSGGVGGNNVIHAFQLLDQYGIEVVAARTGGVNGMSLRLFTACGTVQLRPISSSLSGGD